MGFSMKLLVETPKIPVQQDLFMISIILEDFKAEDNT
jgi:hypothetical protein